MQLDTYLSLSKVQSSIKYLNKITRNIKHFINNKI